MQVDRKSLQLYVIKSTEKLDLSDPNTWSYVLVYSENQLRRAGPMLPFVVDDIAEMFNRFSNTKAYVYYVTEMQIDSFDWEEYRHTLLPSNEL